MLKPAVIAGLLAPSAILRGLGMSSYSHDGSSSCRFGRSLSSSRTPRAASTAQSPEWPSKKSLG